MQGFVRADGRKGIRNVTVVAYLVECAHHVAREMVIPYRDQEVHLLGFPGCFPNAYAHRMLRQLCTHPNVGAVLLVSLESEEVRSLADRILVIYEGRITAEFPPDASEEELGIAMTGGTKQPAEVAQAG